MDALSQLAQQIVADSVKASLHLEGRQERVRRKSRELEFDAFGLSLKQHMTLDALFKSYDTNGNGYIERPELATALKQAGKDCVEDEVDRIMAQFDDDGDGKISFSEFEAAYMEAESKPYTRRGLSRSQ